MTAATRRTAISSSASRKGFPQKWTKAYKLLQKMSFSNLDIAVMAKLVDVDKMEADAAAAKWMKDNEAKWKPWVAAAKM